MCAFVLLAGVHRLVPPQARVMVHQIWLGDRRDDPTAANYSAEDLVLVQRDIGRLAKYTAEMGGSIELLDLALRIPPWEPMHAYDARRECAACKLATEQPPMPVGSRGGGIAGDAGSSQPTRRCRADRRREAAEISERRWAVVDRSGGRTLARRHPLTVEGEEIGSFDLLVCLRRRHDGYDAELYRASPRRRRSGRCRPISTCHGAGRRPARRR